MRARGSASDPQYLEGKARDELIPKRNQVLRPHRRLRQSGIHQEDLDGRLCLLLLRDAGDTAALPAVVDAHSDKRPDYAAPEDNVSVRDPVPGIFYERNGKKLHISFFEIHVKTLTGV
jgi:hypothetical protein